MATRAKVRRRERSGLGHVAAAAKRADEKRAAGSRQFLRIGDGESAILRVLDTGEDFKDGYVHPVEYEYEDNDGKTQERTMNVMCLDQQEKGVPCPGCRDDLDRRYKFWTNVIVRDWENDDGKEEDTVMIWSGGITVARRLDKMDSKHSLAMRDIEIEREGQGLSTKYDLDWADDEDVPLSRDDKKLEKNKTDLSRYVKIRDFDDFYKSPRELNENEDDDDVGAKSRRRGSPFDKKKDSSTRRSGTRRRSSTKTTSKKKTTEKTGLAAVKARKQNGGSSAKKASRPKIRSGSVKMKRR